MTVLKKVHQWFTSDRKMVMASRFSRDGVDLHDVMFSDNLSSEKRFRDSSVHEYQ